MASRLRVLFGVSVLGAVLVELGCGRDFECLVNFDCQQPHPGFVCAHNQCVPPPLAPDKLTGSSSPADAGTSLDPEADLDSGSAPPPDAGQPVADAGVADAGPTSGTYTLNLRNFDAHSGQNIHLKLKSSNGSVVYGEVTAAVSAGGTAQLVLPGVLSAGMTYRADFYADVNQDGLYQFPGDRAWRKTVTAPTSSPDLSERFNYTFAFTDIRPY
jgi:hypothetical protein